jgi:DNA modification methylase
MQVEMVNIDNVRPYEQNPRVNDQAVDAVAASLKAFGFRQPIVTDAEHIIIVGHTRWKAAKKLGLAQVPVHVATDLSPEQARAYRIADNQTSNLSEWDSTILCSELVALGEMGFDLDLLGFSKDDLLGIMSPNGTDGLTDPDSVPAPPDTPITKRGDVWLLGDHHRLLCGDSSSAADLDRLLDGARIHLCNCDPPYNVRVEPRSNNAIAAGNSSFTKSNAGHTAASNHEGLTHHQSFDVARQGKKKATGKMRAKDRPLENDFVSDEAFAEMLLAWFGNMARVLEPGRSFFIWGGYANVANYPPALKACNLYFSQTIIWVKEHPVLTRKDFMGNHEWAFYGWKHDAGHQWFGPNNATDVWSVKKVNPQSMVHLTEKPVELAIRAINYSSQAGENVLDLFGGSGSSLIACEQTGRRAYLMELDQAYCDVICQRFFEFTGKSPRRQADGALWADLRQKAERQATEAVVEVTP